MTSVTYRMDIGGATPKFFGEPNPSLLLYLSFSQFPPLSLVHTDDYSRPKRKLHYFDLLWICCTDESDQHVAALVVLITDHKSRRRRRRRKSPDFEFSSKFTPTIVAILLDG